MMGYSFNQYEVTFIVSSHSFDLKSVFVGRSTVLVLYKDYPFLLFCVKPVFIFVSVVNLL
jgi:hypothetical protein